MAEEVFGRGSHERDVGFSSVASVSGPIWNLATVRGGITLCLCVSVVERSFYHRDTEAQSDAVLTNVLLSDNLDRD